MIVGGEGRVEGVEEGSTTMRGGRLSRGKSGGDGGGKDELDVKGQSGGEGGYLTHPTGATLTGEEGKGVRGREKYVDGG